MKEGASNCVERHLTIATLPFYGHILKWGVSVVFIANALRRTPRVCVILRAVRKRTYVYIRLWRVAIVNCDSRSQRWSRKGKARSKGSESGKPRRHIGLQKDLGYSRRICEVRPCLAPPANDGATWPFPTSDATWELQACVQHWRVRSDNY